VSATRAHVFVSGRVQGVWFRESTRSRADELGLRGWVRNLPDGRVEALFEGEAKAVRLALDWVREGPTHARVEEVVVDEMAASDFDGADGKLSETRGGEGGQSSRFEVR
jgi:acylphosphatase